MSGRRARQRIIEKPIFISGLGRSGTTIIHAMLSTHPHTSWLSLLCDKFPRHPYLNRWLMRAIDIPLLNLYLKYRFIPLENYGFWNLHFGGFFRPCRDLFASDVSDAQKERFARRSNRVADPETNTAAHRRRPVFGECNFLHHPPATPNCHRSSRWRAVADSRMNIDFWRGSGGDGEMVVGPLPEHYKQEWKGMDVSSLPWPASNGNITWTCSKR